MEIDELPSGTQDQKPDIDMNEIVGTHDILMLCFDTLRYDCLLYTSDAADD